MIFHRKPPPGSTRLCTYSMGVVTWYIEPTPEQVRKVAELIERMLNPNNGWKVTIV